MKNITVFLASSDELKNDRNSFHSLVASLDEIFEPRGYRIRCRRWEDFSAFCTGTRTQDDYNRIVRASDICICMFHRKAGEYTIEEFNQALDEYVKNQSHPKTFVYIRALIEGEMEDEALKRFKEDLFDRVGHYWCNYATDDAMKLHFVMQLERIIPSVSGNASVTEGNHFKIENGVVSLYGHKIAELDNLSFAAENPEYLSLKESIARLNTEIARLRATGVAELQPIIDEKQAELYKKRESLNRLESQLFDLALSINKLIGSGTPVSERKRLAIEMFERGNSKGVVEILNEKDIAADAAQARKEIEQGKLLVDSGRSLIEAGLQKTRSLAEEYVLRAKALMTDYAEPRRFELACHAYEQGIELIRANLSEEELAKSLFEYGHFLQTNKRYDLAEARYRENLDIYQRLEVISPQAYEPGLATTQNNLGLLYSDTQCYGESEEMYLSAVEIYQRLSVVNPQVYEPDLARAQNNLGLLYSDTQRYGESEEMYLSAMEIFRELTVANPQAYEPDLARTRNNLGNLYRDTQRYGESEEMYLSAVEIYQRLSVANPQVYEPDLARTRNNLGCLYDNTQRYKESEEMYLSVLTVYQRLTIANLQVYEPDLARAQNNLGNLYRDTQRYKESEEMYLSAVEIYQRLSVANPQVYEPDLAMVQNNLGLLYSDIQRYEDSEKMHLSAVEIYRRLAAANPQVYEPDLAETQNDLGILYSDTRRYEESEEMYLSAMEIRRRLAVANPQVYEPGLARTQYNLGCLYSDTRRYEESEKMYLSAMEIRRRLAVANPQVYEPDLADTQYNLGCLYYNIQRYEESGEMYLSALKVYQRLTVADPQVYEPYLVRACNNLSFLFLAQGNFEEAERYAREGAKYDSTHHTIYTNLAASLLFQGRYAEAEEIYLRYKEELKEDFLSDFEDFYQRGIIPPEREDDVERIKKLLSK
ncbi:tetratricopeptide repeat protein [Barnesiella intestinihominis]|uniref:tetratricopeptide repeat protein n=1 Tax=Barnesiella intestinihominis TaxID=487174 RepID=UPI003AB7964A